MPLLQLNLRHIRAFYHVGLCGHISPVSELVFMSQPAISQAIAKFENLCGTLLFYRQSTGLDLTDAGTLMHNRISRALALLDDGTRQATQRRSEALRLSRQMTITQLRAIVAIADRKNFTHAARAIGTSQPAMSRAIRDLENLCGRVLIEKTGRGIVLTHTAEVFTRSIRLFFNEIRQGQDEVQALHGIDTSILTIGSLPLARSAVLPKAILAFASKKPDVAIHVIDGPYDDVMTGLRHGEIDVLIGALRMPLPFDDVAGKHLFSDSLSIVARSDHPLADQKHVTYDDLLSFPWIAPRDSTPTRDYFNQLIAEEWGGKNPRIIETSSLILIRALLLESDAITIISEQQVSFELNTGVLKRLDIRLNETPRSIGVTIRRAWVPTQTQALFLSELTAVISAMNLPN